jgi:hypothetical protein
MLPLALLRFFRSGDPLLPGGPLMLMEASRRGGYSTAGMVKKE